MPAPLSTIGTLTPGTVSPRREVPSSIARPEYVDRPAPTPFDGPEVKDAETIEKMRVACRLAARALAEVGRHVAPGVSTDELDRIGHEFLLDHGAYPSTLGYKQFPKSLCTSVNEVICHGIPDSTVLAEGDICNIDITGYTDGVHGDTNATFCAGEVDEPTRLLVERTQQATERGIRAVAPGRAVNVIGRVIGASFHSGLIVPHFDSEPHHDDVMQVGMTFTVEPMLCLGTAEWDMWDDGWTVVTKDRRRSAQFEHTVLVTETGPEILTLP
jgi:methionyl aminopeptidase